MASVQAPDITVNDRRNTGKGLCRNPDQPNQFSAFVGIFNQINRRENAERRSKQQGKYCHRNSVDDRRKHRNILCIIGPGKLLQCQVFHTADQNKSNQENQNGKCKNGCSPGNSGQHGGKNTFVIRNLCSFFFFCIYFYSFHCIYSSISFNHHNVPSGSA